jgi:hypothetical protein
MADVRIIRIYGIVRRTVLEIIETGLKVSVNVCHDFLHLGEITELILLGMIL